MRLFCSTFLLLLLAVVTQAGGKPIELSHQPSKTRSTFGNDADLTTSKDGTCLPTSI